MRFFIYFPATLRGDYATGAEVTVDSSDDDETIHIDADGARSDGSVEIRTNQTPAKITGPQLLRYRTELDAYHIAVVDAALAVSTRTDNKEKDFLDEVKTLAVDDVRLKEVPAKFVKMNRSLKAALKATCNNQTELQAQIDTEDRRRDGGLTARQILSMIHAFFATDTSALEVITVAHIVAHQYQNYGDDKADLYWTEWVRLTTRMKDPLTNAQLEQILRAELGKSPGMVQWLFLTKRITKTILLTTCCAMPLQIFGGKSGNPRTSFLNRNVRSGLTPPRQNPPKPLLTPL